MMHAQSQHGALLSVSGVAKGFGPASDMFWAVRDASLDVRRGECLAIVGESGSGKTTLARMMVGLTKTTSGTVRLEETDIAELVKTRTGLKTLSSRMQMVFQDPYSSLDPTMRISDIIAEPLRILGRSRVEIESRVGDVLDMVGLAREFAQRRPRELSGGQRQRIGIARALGPAPEILVLDEPVASLDVSMQGQVLKLLADIKQRTNIAIVMIAHDLGVVRAIADRTVVMYSGRIVEAGPTPDVFNTTLHPYTRALLWSVSARSREIMPDAVAEALANEPLRARERLEGCVFRSRCWRRVERCETEVDRQGGKNHVAFCNVPCDQDDGVRS